MRRSTQPNDVRHSHNSNSLCEFRKGPFSPVRYYCFLILDSFFSPESILVAARTIRYPQYHCMNVSVRLHAVKKPTTPTLCTVPACENNGFHSCGRGQGLPVLAS